ncbi:MAG: mechanosensitive ion channel [Neisseriaceae bacterium]|nr:mechanosensitive ion channel [Neisseriaceae bacterium]
MTDIDTLKTWLWSHEKLLVQYGMNIVSALLVLGIGLWVAKAVTKYSHNLMTTKQLDPTATSFFTMLIRYGIVVCAVIAAMGSLGVKTTPFITLLGASGLAVGLALRNSLSNFAAGVILAIFRPIRLGDSIDVGGKAGVVENITIFSTRLLQADGIDHTIPNNTIITSNVTNFTRQPQRRTELIISVSYEADIDQVKAILHDILAAEGAILQEKGVTVELNELSASSMNFVVRYWTSLSDIATTRWHVLEAVKKRFDANGVVIPYQTMSLMIASKDQPAAE